MPKPLRDALPDLIRQCLGVETVYRFEALQQQVIDVAPTRGGFMQLIGRG